tara:strand:- start:1359 stop:2840 length:1482 start_codon:yes stop_codon:yes gene_type:complete
MATGVPDVTLDQLQDAFLNAVKRAEEGDEEAAAAARILAAQIEEMTSPELEETEVLTQDERLGQMAVVPVSDDVYGNVSFDPNAGIVGGLKRGIEAPGAVLRGEAPPEQLLETALMASPMPTASRAASRAYRTMVPTAPTREALQEAAQEGYKAVKDSGAEYSVPAIKEFAQNLQGRLDAEGFIEPITGGVHELIKKLVRVPKNSVAVPITSLDAFRRRMSALQGNPDNTISAAASIGIKAVDDFIEAAGKTPSMAGPRSPSGAAELAAKAIVPARANAAAGFRSDAIRKLEDAVELRSGGSHSGLNVDNTIRQKIASLLLNDKKMRGFNATEKEAMRDVVRGSPTKNAARYLSNLLGGGGGMAQSLKMAGGGLAGFNMGGDVTTTALGAMIPATLGTSLRNASNYLGRRELEKLDNLVRSRSPAGGGGPVSQYAPREYLRVPGRAGGRAALMEMGRALQQPKSLSENRPKSQLERRREEAYKRWFYGRGGGV